MRVTVTGATGLIGTRVVAALQERGDEVTVLSRRLYPGESGGINLSAATSSREGRIRAPRARPSDGLDDYR